ncbi:MAG: HAMP domain-containing protein [Spirochaetaceae bacterium]|jgi:adenylate cyclase|nr:HAMP domain-containing protein [Spirochaetaceae bacterium]
MALDALPRLRGVRFPLGAKLVTIITSFLVLSLGAISILVSMLISADVRITAEDNNFTLNRRIATGVETFFETVMSNTRTFLTLGSAFSGQNQTAFFFTKNPHIAAVLTGRVASEDAPGGFEATGEFLNEEFIKRVFTGGPGPDFSPKLFKETSLASLERAARGETFVLNGSPYFGVSMIILFFPWSDLDGAAVFFSGEELLRDFVSGGIENFSFLINKNGDVLIHPETELFLNAHNLEDHGLVKTALERKDRNFQTVYTEDGTEYFGAYQRLAETGTVLITRIATAAVLRTTRAVVRRNIQISAAVLALSVLFVILFSGTISRPIKALVAASAAIEKGDYRIQLKHRSQDEIGLLTRTFIGMGHSLENFEKFTNKAMVRLARQGALTRTGAAKTVAVSFTLIRDFRELALNFEASGLVAFVNAFLSRIVPCITCTGGIVDKFLTHDGVVVMALWGAAGHSGQERHILACLRSALMIRAVICNWNAERAAARLRKKETGNKFFLLKTGCGINIGEVIAGQIGSEERMEYTVIGDPVNLAARMEGPNDLFDTDILITENAWKLAGASLVTEEMDSLEVKGKQKPLRVFSVVNTGDKKEAGKILSDLSRMPRTNPLISKRCAGPQGPKTMTELRRNWEIFLEPGFLSREAGRSGE